MPSMRNSTLGTLLARRASTTLTVQNPTSSRRFFCAPPSSSSSSPPQNNRLFVGGLSWSVDEKSLKDAFSSFGEVTEVKIVYDRDSGGSRGFGFVNFSNEDEAQVAKDAMDGRFAGSAIEGYSCCRKSKGRTCCGSSPSQQQGRCRSIYMNSLGTVVNG